MLLNFTVFFGSYIKQNAKLSRDIKGTQILFSHKIISVKNLGPVLSKMDDKIKNLKLQNSLKNYMLALRTYKPIKNP